MNIKLFVEALSKLIAGILVTGLCIFVPAGTMFFSNGWLFMAVLFVPMFPAGVILMVKNPALLKRRLNAKEKQKEQKMIVSLSALMFIGGFITAGLDYRFGWSRVPGGVTVLATVIFLLSYLLYAEVIRENTFLSRTIAVQKNQTVIDTGLYGIVRHPMYLSTVCLFLSMPFILGSFFSFFVFLAYPFMITKRITLEEALLEKELAGYTAYKKKVKYRLIPFLW